MIWCVNVKGERLHRNAALDLIVGVSPSGPPITKFKRELKSMAVFESQSENFSLQNNFP